MAGHEALRPFISPVPAINLERFHEKEGKGHKTLNKNAPAQPCSSPKLLLQGPQCQPDLAEVSWDAGSLATLPTVAQTMQPPLAKSDHRGDQQGMPRSDCKLCGRAGFDVWPTAPGRILRCMQD